VDYRRALEEMKQAQQQPAGLAAAVGGK
jgi:hypothetical protein